MNRKFGSLEYFNRPIFELEFPPDIFRFDGDQFLQRDFDDSGPTFVHFRILCKQIFAFEGGQFENAPVVDIGVLQCFVFKDAE